MPPPPPQLRVLLGAQQVLEAVAILDHAEAPIEPCHGLLGLLDEPRLHSAFRQVCEEGVEGLAADIVTQHREGGLPVAEDVGEVQHEVLAEPRRDQVVGRVQPDDEVAEAEVGIRRELCVEPVVWLLVGAEVEAAELGEGRQPVEARFGVRRAHATPVALLTWYLRSISAGAYTDFDVLRPQMPRSCSQLIQLHPRP